MKKKVSKSEDPNASDNSDEVGAVGYRKNLRAYLEYIETHKKIFKLRADWDFNKRFELIKKFRGRTEFYEMR